MPQPSLFEFDAIGTHFWCEALNGQISNKLRHRILHHAKVFDATYSRFIPSSLIGQLNSIKHLDRPPKELLAMLDFAKELYEVSEGAFDITVGGTLHAQGYGSREFASSIVPDFWKSITYDTDSIDIPNGAVLDFGGFGKGWLIDDFVTLFKDDGMQSFIINGGGDMFIENSNPIEIALEHPDSSVQALTALPIRHGFAASSQAKRQWQDGDIQKSHIVDPVRNDTAQSVVASAFVQASTATIADAMATILFLRPELHRSLKAKYDLQVLLVKN